MCFRDIEGGRKLQMTLGPDRVTYGIHVAKATLPKFVRGRGLKSVEKGWFIGDLQHVASQV